MFNTDNTKFIFDNDYSGIELQMAHPHNYKLIYKITLMNNEQYLN